MKRTPVIAIVSVVAVGTTAAIVVANTFVHKPNDKHLSPASVKSVSLLQAAAQKATQAPTVEPTTTQTVISQTTTPTTSTQTQKTTTIQPDYGEDPNNPGIYIVFNKTSVMTEAGIPSNQQSAADTLISYLMNWRYKVSGHDADLCYIVPLSKMASSGSDYETNPVTQLSYCNELVQSRFGSWQQALDSYNKSPSYGIFD
jgi:hypothetical protein